MSGTVADIRKDYKQRSLLEKDIEQHAMRQFDKWWQEAVRSEIDEVNAMTLATASADGVPAARIVLLKGYDDLGFVFYTNYDSFKGKQMEENPRACLVFFWKELERQVRITGLVEKVSAGESDAYFESRPEGSRIGAIVSPQSMVIANRQWLDERKNEITASLKSKKIQRPTHWGGYRVKPISIEFWQGRSDRLHDRIQYTLKDSGDWLIER